MCCHPIEVMKTHCLGSSKSPYENKKNHNENSSLICPRKKERKWQNCNINWNQSFFTEANGNARHHAGLLLCS